MTGLQQSGHIATGLMDCIFNPPSGLTLPPIPPVLFQTASLCVRLNWKLLSQTFKNRGGATTEVFYIGAPMSHQARRALEF
jgi:hypothetical protein